MNIKYNCIFKDADGKEQKVSFKDATYALVNNSRGMQGQVIKLEEDVNDPLTPSELDILFGAISTESTDVELKMSINGNKEVIVLKKPNIVEINYVVEPRETGLFRKIIGIK